MSPGKDKKRDLFLAARSEWISRSHFHPISEKDVLNEVSQRVARHKNPVVLLDLDSTLYDVGPRTQKILQEWVESPVSSEFPEVRKALTRLEAKHLGFSVRDTLIAVGLAVDGHGAESATKAVKTFWSERFFTSRYLPFDRPYPLAAKFTQEVHGLGAEIVYLTGRDEPMMGDGTRSNLIRDGFPWNQERTHLILKPHRSMLDLVHKMAAADKIRSTGTLVASFENEPPNLVALSELFPDAMHVFVETVCSDHLANPGKNLYRIKGFGA